MGRALASAFVRRLEACRAALEASAWFGRHEVVSGSILFVWDEACQDAAAAGAAPAAHGASTWMIDFAKTRELASPRAATAPPSRTAPWADGNPRTATSSASTRSSRCGARSPTRPRTRPAAEAEIEAEEAEMEADVAAASPSVPPARRRTAPRA